MINYCTKYIMNLSFIDDIIDESEPESELIIHNNPDIYNTIPTNTYWYDRVIHYINNIIYYDDNQITNVQYHRIMDFLQHFR
jgi:hypothetical protein